MYLTFFNFRVPPYAVGYDERLFYEGRLQAEVLSRVLPAIQQRQGMVLITGRPGAGKTFLGRVLAARLGPEAATVVFDRPPATGRQLLRGMAEALRLRVARDEDKLRIAERVHERLESLHRSGRLAVLVLDEAQALTDEALEEVRLMWNWEVDCLRLVQIVLIGQEELRQRLLEARWESVRQRIARSCHLGALDADDTVRYVLHRRKAASGHGCLLRFTSHALESIHQATGGIPRLINTLCENVLATACRRSTFKVTSEIVQEAAAGSVGWQSPAADVRPSP